MRRLGTVLQETITTGTVTNLCCAGCAAALGVLHHRKAAQPINAISHVVWGDEQPPTTEVTWHDTAVGLIVNQAACSFWALLHVALLPPRQRDPGRTVFHACAISGLAYLVDYHMVPSRFTPGFEKVLPRRAFVPIYIAIASGLAAGALLCRRLDRNRR
ncbi:hypothetical protein [Nitrospira sp. Nam74]